MFTSFVIKEHTFPGQHIREYPNALASSQEDVLLLHAKQYIPTDNQNPQPGDVTLIAAHANGFCKEVYEPLWEELLARSRGRFRIRSIWMVDMAAQGESGVLNEDVLGNDPHWFDHSRDLLTMVHQFREQMPRPIVGIGHSLGGAQMVFLSHMHPRLFSSLVLIDTTISLVPARNVHRLYKAVLGKPDLFSSREEAVEAMRKSPAFKGWKPEPLRKYMEHLVRSTPTAVYPDLHDKVTLRTTKYAELTATTRPNVEGRSLSFDALLEERRTHPDVDPDAPLSAPVYQHSAREAYRCLSSIRPSVLYLNGRGSTYVLPDDCVERSRITGVGIGGNGGERLGRVKTVTLDGGHFLPMTNPSQTAEKMAAYLGIELRRWKEEEAAWHREWSSRNARDKKVVPKDVITVIQRWDGIPRGKSTKL